MFSCSFWVAVIANICAQGLKPIIERMQTGKWDISLLFVNGKFPSSHTATVSALTIRIAIDCGLSSNYFAICFILSSIVVADATGVRQEVGKHAKYINDHILNRKPNDPVVHFPMKELIGHNMVEVLGGFALGAIIVLISLVLCSPYCH
ncbi:MAG: divergent PAP2 family protein [Caldisericia bacterium]|nr:divergent PAP2 family protein [Caldisericia bacterium]MDD4614024.1 divergent PAP2 family protein [Caldisericia bacterium]